jgi:hypothetical protein
VLVIFLYASSPANAERRRVIRGLPRRSFSGGGSLQKISTFRVSDSKILRSTSVKASRLRQGYDGQGKDGRPNKRKTKMRDKKNRYISEAVKEMIKVRDLKPAKDAKGGVLPCGPGSNPPKGNPHGPQPLTGNMN